MSNLHFQVNDNTPVLVGCSQYLDKKGPEGLNYLDILKIACEKALNDCEAKVSLKDHLDTCLLYTSPSPRDQRGSRMPSSA